MHLFRLIRALVSFLADTRGAAEQNMVGAFRNHFASGGGTGLRIGADGLIVY